MGLQSGKSIVWAGGLRAACICLNLQKYKELQNVDSCLVVVVSLFNKDSFTKYSKNLSQ